MARNACRDCHWWDTHESVLGKPLKVAKTVSENEKETVEVGLCRKHSPFLQGFPSTREDDWCGEFSKKTI